MRPNARTCSTAAVVAALLLSGCSSERPAAERGPEVPAEEAFAEGTCRMAAPDVRAVGRAIPDLGEGGTVAEDVKDALREAQPRLSALAAGAEPALEPALRELVEKIGIVRIRADGNSYETQFGDRLTEAYDRVVEVCTEPADAG